MRQNEKQSTQLGIRPTASPEMTEKAIRLLIETLQKSIWSGMTAPCAWKNCTAALALAYDPDCRVYDVIEALPDGNGAMDKIALLNTMANLGHYARAAETTPGDVDNRLLPCLYVPAGISIVPFVILAKSKKGITIYDADQNAVRRLAHTHDISSCHGEAYFFQAYDAHLQSTSKFMRGGTGNSWFRALLGRFSDYFMQVVIAGLALNLIALASPLYMMFVYDSVISPADIGSLLPITAGVVIALVTEYALRRTRSTSLSWLSARLDNLIGNKIFSHLIGLPPDLIERASVAAQIARIKTFESVRDLFSGSIFLSFLEIPYVILALVLIGIIAGPLVMVPFLMMFAYAAFFAYMRRKIKVTIRLAAKSSSARQQFTIETFEKLVGIHTNGLSRIWGKKFDDIAAREIVMNFQLSWLGTIAETCAQGLTLLSAVATVGYGAHLIWAGSISTGALIASMMLVWRVLTPFYSLCAMIPRLEQLRSSIAQVNDLMDLETEQETAASFARLPVLRGRITFTAAALRYHGDNDPIFAGLSLDIKPGSLVAVTGKNGAGKTSLLKLAKGMYPAAAGSVRIDGFDIRQLDSVHLRRHIAYVPQRPEFFTGSLSDNLKISRPLASTDEMEQALFLADALEEVNKMPDGIRTVIDPAKIPAGLAARLSLARAYLHGGSILLIDELPGSLLNDRAGDNLRRYLEKSKGKRTVILVTHRDDMLVMADEIIELRRSEVPRHHIHQTTPPDTFEQRETA